jgi:hypothetical protein
MNIDQIVLSFRRLGAKPGATFTDAAMLRLSSILYEPGCERARAVDHMTGRSTVHTAIPIAR